MSEHVQSAVNGNDECSTAVTELNAGLLRIGGDAQVRVHVKMDGVPARPVFSINQTEWFSEGIQWTFYDLVFSKFVQFRFAIGSGVSGVSCIDLPFSPVSPLAPQQDMAMPPHPKTTILQVTAGTQTHNAIIIITPITDPGDPRRG